MKRKDIIEKNNKKHLVIGAGEVGKSLYNVLKSHYDIAIRDKDNEVEGKFNVLHICYPPFENFVEVTKKYIEEYEPELVIVHSTVSVGTTRKIGALAVHSPIRGVHPRLEEGIKTFVKYFGGEKAKEAALYFSDIGVKTQIFELAETTELLKILSTTHYGWNIVFAKEAKRICDELGLDFDEVYTMPNRDYNDGYKKLGMEHVIRPVLKDVPGKIGGHCVVPNCDLLDDWLTEVIKERNQVYGSDTNTLIHSNDTNQLLYPELSYILTGLCYKVHNKLGRFCREKQYADEFEKLLTEHNIKFSREHHINNLGKGVDGNIVDFLIEEKIIIDFKAKKFLTKEDYYQMLRYLESSNLRLGLIINFRHTYLKPKRVINLKNKK